MILYKMKKIYVAPAVEVIALAGQKIMTGSGVSSDTGYQFNGGLGASGSSRPSEGLSYEIDFDLMEDSGW